MYHSLFKLFSLGLMFNQLLYRTTYFLVMRGGHQRFRDLTMAYFNARQSVTAGFRGEKGCRICTLESCKWRKLRNLEANRIIERGVVSCYKRRGKNNVPSLGLTPQFYQ